MPSNAPSCSWFSYCRTVHHTTEMQTNMNPTTSACMPRRMPPDTGILYRRLQYLQISGQSTTNSGKYLIMSLTAGLKVKAKKMLLKLNILIGTLPNQGLKKLQILCLLSNMKPHFPMAHFSLSWIPLDTKCFGILWLAECKTRSRAAKLTWGAVVEDNIQGFTQRLDRRTNIVKLAKGKERGHSRTARRKSRMCLIFRVF